jgi:hypothetical protein
MYLASDIPCKIHIVVPTITRGKKRTVFIQDNPGWSVLSCPDFFASLASSLYEANPEDLVYESRWSSIIQDNPQGEFYVG